MAADMTFPSGQSRTGAGSAMRLGPIRDGASAESDATSGRHGSGTDEVAAASPDSYRHPTGHYPSRLWPARSKTPPTAAEFIAGATAAPTCWAPCVRHPDMRPCRD